MYNNKDGSSNTGIGDHALYSNTGGFDNTAVGIQSLYKNTTGTENTAFGLSALYSNSTGSFNSAFGNFALTSNTTGKQNTATGYAALRLNSTGYWNTAIGYAALSSNTTGIANAATGDHSLFANTTGYNNTADGRVALQANTTGAANTAIGEGSLNVNTTGGNNTAVGANAIYNNITGSYNTAIGENAYFTANNLNNTTCIGYNSGHIANADNRIEIGNTSITWIGGEVGWSTYSDARIKENVKGNVPGLSFINKLQPVTYNYNIHKQDAMLYKNKKNITDWSSKYDIEKQRFTGFIAQDVEKAASDLKYDFSGLVKPTNDNDLYSLRYSDFVVPLVKAVQELSSQNDSLKQTNQALSDKLNALSNKIDFMENAMSNCCNSFSSAMQTMNSNKSSARVSAARLEQNIPNPFNNSSSVSYYIPSGFHIAQLMITDAAGRVLKTYSIERSGLGKQIISSSELASGVYQYSLLVNGKIMDTKKMVLVK